MRIAGWDALEYSSEIVGAFVEELAPALEHRRFLESRTTSPSVPRGFAHHGVGGDALCRELARMLDCPALERAVSLALVPFSIGVQRHLEEDREHVIAEADRLTARWPATHDAHYADAVVAARAAVQRGAPTELEHCLWLEHFLVEQLLPVASRLGLPVIITWPGRRARAGEPLDTTLDAALASWE